MADVDFVVETCEKSGQVKSVKLFGEELLDGERPCASELFVNGRPLKLRAAKDTNDTGRELKHMKGEQWVDHFTGWGLVVARKYGGRGGMKHKCFGVQTLIRREIVDQTLPCPGPGGPPIEAPLHVDTFGVMNWNWKFWGDKTRMIFPSAHASGPAEELGHVGYEHDTPENCKKYMGNVWRRVYPSAMMIHGGLFYNIETGHWVAITCRRPTVGYILNIEDAGRGVGYDFTLHAPFGIGDVVNLPEVKIYYGKNRDEMMAWLGDYVSKYYEETPEWVQKTLWKEGLAWNIAPTWTEQAKRWEAELKGGDFTGLSYSLVTSRPLNSGTSPISYEPDTNHGSKEEFKKMCLKMDALGVPMLIWMSHSGLEYQGNPEYDEDWYIRGIDGRVCASWGSIDHPDMIHINPGHPGYIEYTKKWIRFYIGECKCKGIFFDCLSWAFPADFRPRKFMRFPGDTNRMAVKFQEEAYACIKECNPEAIMLGEGGTLDAPVNILAINHDPKRGIDGFGPRDFFLQLNQHSPKRFVIEQGPKMCPGAGMCSVDPRGGPEAAARNKYMAKLLKEKGGRDVWRSLPGDLSVMGDLLVVPVAGDKGREVQLPADLKKVKTLVSEVGKGSYALKGGKFVDVMAGIYRMK